MGLELSCTTRGAPGAPPCSSTGREDMEDAQSSAPQMVS
jgi:hypothetical protein